MEVQNNDNISDYMYKGQTWREKFVALAVFTPHTSGLHSSSPEYSCVCFYPVKSREDPGLPDVDCESSSCRHH